MMDICRPIVHIESCCCVVC